MKSKQAVLTLAIIIMVASYCGAAVISVPGDYGSIQAAFNAAVTGDTIQVTDQGVYAENVIFADKDITVASVPAGATIKGLGAVPAYNAGPIHVYTGTLTLDGFIIDSNATTQFGIWVENGPANVLVKNGTIKNVATDYGYGAYSAGPNAILTLQNCTLSDRQAYNAYLAGVDYGATLNIDKCKLIDNLGYAKGVRNDGGTLNMTNSLVYASKGYSTWGLVYISDASASTTNTTNINYCTIVDDDFTYGSTSCIGLYSSTGTTMNLTLKNSIVAGNPWNAVRNHGTTTINYVEDYCLMASRSDTIFGLTGGTNRLASVYPQPYADYPRFLDAHSDFRLAYSTSPAVDSADAANNIGVDLNGAVRDSLPDRGCLRIESFSVACLFRSLACRRLRDSRQS